MREFFQVIILGIVQGITEWLPISSTGHLLLVQSFMNTHMTDAFLSVFNVVIQFGSILAVVVLYFHKLNPFSAIKSTKQKQATIQLWVKVIIATIPAAIIGLLFDDWIDEHLFNPYVVSAALVFYGIIFIIVERWRADKPDRISNIYQLSVQTALAIGLFQVLALLPGTSRSGATIIGALLIGTARGVAAEFTFFLAIPVMFGASLLRIIGYGFNYTGTQVALLLVGTAVSFIVSIIAIKFLMAYIKKNDFTVFGYYRIIIGVVMFLIFGIRALMA